MMTLIVIGLDTTQLCTELIVCDWNCQDFFCAASEASVTVASVLSSKSNTEQYLPSNA